MAAVTPRGNLDSSAQDMQMRAGLIALALALLSAVALDHRGATPGLRVLAFLPFFVAAYGVLSALYRTCGFSALAGKRMTPDGAERVADREELTSQRKVGMRVLGLSFALAATATALLVLAS
jgi:hypothetical protein